MAWEGARDVNEKRSVSELKWTEFICKCQIWTGLIFSVQALTFSFPIKGSIQQGVGSDNKTYSLKEHKLRFLQGPSIETPFPPQGPGSKLSSMDIVGSSSTATVGWGSQCLTFHTLYKSVVAKRFFVCDYNIVALLIALMSRKNRNQMNTEVEEEGFFKCSMKGSSGEWGVTRLTYPLREHQLRAYSWIVRWR